MSILQSLIREFKKLKNIHLNRNIVTYLICVAIASILWLLNALNKEYSADITYPIRYINLPEGKYPVTKLPTQLLLEVKAKGFTLLGHSIRTSFLPITFNVSTYSSHFRKKNDIYEYTLHTNDIKDKISSQLSSDIKLQNVAPEEIIFKFSDTDCKKVAIHPMIKYTLKRQYILNSLSLNPDSILVCGPGIYIDTLQYVNTYLLNLKEIGKTTSHKVKLQPIPDCTFEDREIEIKLEIEKFTEAKRSIAITPTNVPDSMNLRLFPASVNISYEIGLSKYDKITDHDFTFTVVYPKQNQASYLEIIASKFPSYIKNLSFSPQKVEYILEKK